MRESEISNREYLLGGGGQSAVQVENFPRYLIDTDSAIAATGVMLSVAVPMSIGDIVTSITFKSGATAAGTPLNWFFALYDPDLALMAQTADQTTTAWAANTAKTVALASAQHCTVEGVYYASIAMVATTIVTVLGRDLALAGAAVGVLGTDAELARTSGSSLTDTAPATITSDTDVATYAYCVLT